jgi:hypothetical protein
LERLKGRRHLEDVGVDGRIKIVRGHDESVSVFGYSSCIASWVRRYVVG